MKTIITLVTLGLGISFSNAQTVKEAAVPAAVKDALKKAYPTAKVEKWQKEDANYEAEIEVGKVESSLLYDASGNLLETEVEIKVSELPKAVTDYINTNLKGKKTKEASKITDSNGKVSYEAEVDEADYMFDETGNFLKKIVEKDKDDDDKK